MCIRDRIYLMDEEGRLLRKLTDNDVDDAVSRWSPDGNHVIYQSEGERGNWEICVMDLRTGKERRITQGEDWYVEPAWQPRHSTVGVNPLVDFRITWGWIKGETLKKRRSRR